MKQKRDAAAASVVAAVLILAVVALSAGLWAAAVLPTEQHAEAEADAEMVQETLIESRFVMSGAAKHTHTRGIPFGILLPKGTLTTENHGSLQVNGTVYPLKSIALQAGGTTQGILGSGVWRKDAENAAWILLPETSFEAGALSLELLEFSGDITYGSTEGIPFVFRAERDRMKTETGKSITITVVSDDGWILNLWKTYFNELRFQYKGELEVTHHAGTNSLSAELSAEDYPNLTLQITEVLCSLTAGDSA